MWKGFKVINETLAGTANTQAPKASIKITNGQAVITATEANLPLAIYTLQGATVYMGKTTAAATQAIGLPQRGVCIIGIGEQSAKVVY